MKVPTTPTTRESSKQRALRIVLDYHRRGDALTRSKYFWLAVGGLVATAYLGWLLFGGVTAQEHLSPGKLAAVHSSLNSQCAECHEDFTPLSGDADGSQLLLTAFSKKTSAHDVHANKVSCAKCHPSHAENPHHSNQLAADLTSCAACHADHRGAAAFLARPADSACTNCHQDIAAHRTRPLDEPPIQNVSQFAKTASNEFAHPPFRSLPQTDTNHFKFNHQLHMLPGQWPKDGKPEGAWKLRQIPAELREQYRSSPDQTLDSLVQLDCKSCHVTETSTAGSNAGAHMLPIVFEQHCRACHPLEVSKPVDGKLTSWNIRHGLRQSEIREILLGISASNSNRESNGEHSPPRLTPNQPLPGKTPGNNLAQNLNDPGQVEAWQKSLFRDQCLKCHADESPQPAILGEPADFVKPVLPERWLQHASFNHRTHESWANCRDCHAGAYATDAAAKPPLDDAAVLIPNIDNCVQCHAPSSTHATFRAAARFDCAECHRYHQGPH
jgi:hypothetical protein